MPVGPNGEKRPAELVANAILSMKIAIGEAEEEITDFVDRQVTRPAAPSMLPRPSRTSLLIAAARWSTPT